MYKVIMVPTDGSGSEEAAIALAVRLAQRFEAELRLVRVDTPQLVIEPITSAAGFAQTQLAITEARLTRLRKLEALGAQCRALGEICVITALEDGPVSIVLKEYAERFHVDLIVMTSHLRGGVARMTLGSVTDFLARHTDIPVLVVKNRNLMISSGDNFNRIVVPLDGSALAEELLPHLAALASYLNATVSLIQVLVPSGYAQKEMLEPAMPWWENEIAQSNEYLNAAADYLREAGATVSTEVILSDAVADAILDYVTRSRADLIAITTTGAGGLGRMIFGSVADEITRKATASVLVLHPSSRIAGTEKMRVTRQHTTAS